MKKNNFICRTMTFVLVSLLIFSVTACSGNSSSDNNAKESEKTKQLDIVKQAEKYKNDDAQYEDRLKNVDYLKGDLAGEYQIYIDNNLDFMTEEETTKLKVGDIVSKVPNRRVLEEKGLDFVFVFKSYKQVSEGEFASEPTIDWEASYILPAKEYEGEWIDTNGETIMGLHKWTGDIEILEAKYVQSPLSNEWQKLLYKDGNNVEIGKVYSLKHFSDFLEEM